jgi:hypothetical protein
MAPNRKNLQDMPDELLGNCFQYLKDSRKDIQNLRLASKALFGSSMVRTLTVNVPTIDFLPNTTSIAGTLIRRNIEKAMAH